MNRPSSYCILLFAFVTTVTFGQMRGSAGANAGLEPRAIIDVPTAGILPHGNIGFDVEFFQQGGVLVGLSGGLFNRVELGIAYGGTNLLGALNPTWNQLPGWKLKFRMFEETASMPAFVLGFDSQGKELYIDSLSRYTIKSPGIYAVASKNYQLLGYFGIHGGINYSLERSDGDSDPNFFVGVDKALGPIFSIVAEYNFGLNDSNREALGKGKGYLNAGFRTSFGNGFTFGFNLKDVTRNQQDISIGNRTIQLEFVRSL